MGSNSFFEMRLLILKYRRRFNHLSPDIIHSLGLLLMPVASDMIFEIWGYCRIQIQNSVRILCPNSVTNEIYSKVTWTLKIIRNFMSKSESTYRHDRNKSISGENIYTDSQSQLHRRQKKGFNSRPCDSPFRGWTWNICSQPMNYRGQGNGSIFMHVLERWLSI